MENKTHWKNQHNYDYLGAYSLLPGQELVLTIKSIRKEAVTGAGGKKQECMVATFSEPQKPMVLNRTNCKTIEKLYKTPYTEDWIGKKIKVFATEVDAFGEKTDALRIRKELPQDHSVLIKAIRECKTEEAIMVIYNLNKDVWAGDVKQAATETKERIKNGNPSI